MPAATTGAGAARVRYVVRRVSDALGCDLPPALAAERPVTPERRAAYGLLMALLGEFGPFALSDIAKDALGRPYVRGHPGLALSLAHCAGCGAAAVADGTGVGIDVEGVTSCDRDTGFLVLTPAQHALIAAAPDPARAFTQLWVRKEAAGKALGVGIDSDVLAAPVEGNEIALRGRRIRIRDIAAPDGVLAALALTEEVPK